MRVLLCVFLGLFAALFSCDKGFDKAATNKRPSDFSIEYYWNAGMQPRPHYFEYTLTINQAGEGRVVMIPGRAAETVPRWTETFSVQEKELDELYQGMVKNGLFTRPWKPLEPEPPGCHSRTLTVTASGKQFVIEDCLPSDEKALAEIIYSAVAATVPKAIWDKLDRQREEYMGITVSTGQEFTLKVGAEAALESEKLRIKFRSVLEDSRCPEGADCVWIGQARILIEVQQADNKLEEFELNTNPGEKREARYRGYKIELKRLEPYPGRPVEGYRATFVVGKG